MVDMESQLAITYSSNYYLNENADWRGETDNIRLLNTKRFSRVYLKMLISARNCLPIQQLKEILSWNNEYFAFSQITSK